MSNASEIKTNTSTIINELKETYVASSKEVEGEVKSKIPKFLKSIHTKTTEIREYVEIATKVLDIVDSVISNETAISSYFSRVTSAVRSLHVNSLDAVSELVNETPDDILNSISSNVEAIQAINLRKAKRGYSADEEACSDLHDLMNNRSVHIVGDDELV